MSSDVISEPELITVETDDGGYSVEVTPYTITTEVVDGVTVEVLTAQTTIEVSASQATTVEVVGGGHQVLVTTGPPAGSGIGGFYTLGELATLLEGQLDSSWFNAALKGDIDEISALFARLGDQLDIAGLGDLTTLEGSMMTWSSSQFNTLIARVTLIDDPENGSLTLAWSEIDQTADHISTLVGRVDLIDGPGGSLEQHYTLIDQTAEAVTIEADARITLDGRVEEYNSTWTATAQGLASVVTRVTTLDDPSTGIVVDHESRIQQNADNISLYVNQLNNTSGLVNQAGIDITALGVRVTATETSGGETGYRLEAIEELIANKWSVNVQESVGGYKYMTGMEVLLHPMWLLDYPYVVDKTVYYTDDKAYTCILPHTSTGGNAPGNTMYWTEIPGDAKTVIRMKADQLKFYTSDSAPDQPLLQVDADALMLGYGVALQSEGWAAGDPGYNLDAKNKTAEFRDMSMTFSASKKKEAQDALNITELYSPLVNPGFEAGTHDSYEIPDGWFIESSETNPEDLLRYINIPADTSSGLLGYGASVHNQSGTSCGYWKLGKRFDIVDPGYTFSVTVQCRIQGDTTDLTTGNPTDGAETWVAEDDAYIEFRCYEEDGTPITTLTLAEQYSKTASHQDYINGGNVERVFGSGTWVPLTHSITIPANCYRLEVLLCTSDGNNNVYPLGHLDVNAAVIFDDFTVNYTGTFYEVFGAEWYEAAVTAIQNDGRFRNNLFSIEEWTEGRTVFDGDFAIYKNNTNHSNEIISSVGPFGNTVLAWEATCMVDQYEPLGSWSGGFEHRITAAENKFDHTKTYRFSCWVKTSWVDYPSGSPGPSTYGLYVGHDTVSPYDVAYLGTTAAVTNPYMIPNQSAPTLNKWYLLVTITHGSGTTLTTPTGQTGWWDPETGTLVQPGTTEYKWLTTATEALLRCSMYRQSVDAVTEFYAPRWDELNGSEPSIVALLNAATVGGTWGSNINDIPYETLHNNDDATALGMNPTFSNWGTSLPANWTKGGTVGVAPELTIKRIGEQSIKFTTTGVQGYLRCVAQMDPNAPLSAGTFVSGMVDVYIPDGVAPDNLTGGPPGIMVRLMTNATLSAYVDLEVAADMSILDQWQRLKYTARCPGKRIHGIYFYLMPSFGSTKLPVTTGTVYYDNLNLALFDISQDANAQLPSDVDLLGYWDFNEGAGGNAFDKSQFGNTGVLMQDTSWRAGISGTGVEFDGVGDRVVIPNTAPIDGLGSTYKNLTFSFWAWPQVSGASAFLFSKYESGTDKFGLVVLTDGQVRFDIGYNGAAATHTFTDTNVDGDDQWYHFALVIDATNAVVKLYINGILHPDEYAMGSYASAFENAADFAIGATDTGSAPYNGYIDEFRIYDRVLTELEVQALYRNPSGGQSNPDWRAADLLPQDSDLAGYWDLNEAAGNIAYDKSGEQNHGTLTFSPGWVHTIAGHGVELVQTSHQYIALPDDIVDISAGCAVSLWFKPALGAGDAQARIISLLESTGTLDQLVLTTHSNTNFGIAAVVNTTQYQWRTDAADFLFEADTWYHLVVCLDASQRFTVYINALPMTVATVLSLGDSSISGIGAYNGSTYGGQGVFTEVRVYNRVLTAQEARALYKNPSGHQTNPNWQENPAIPPDTDLLGYWDLNEGTGTIAHDKSPFANNGTISGNPEWVYAPAGLGLLFDASDDITLPDMAPLSSIGASGGYRSVTFSAWVTNPVPGQTTSGFIVGSYDSSSGEYIYFHVNSGNKLAFIAKQSGVSYGGNGTLDVPMDGEWHHLVAIIDAENDSVTYMVDGVTAIVNDVGWPADWALPGKAFHISSNTSSSNDYLGAISEVRIYRRALSEAEARTLYRNPSGNAAPPAYAALLGTKPPENATYGADWAEIWDRPGDALLLNELNGIGGYQGVEFPRLMLPNHIDCWADNWSGTNYYMKIASATLDTNNYSLSWDGLFQWGASGGRFTKQMRVHIHMWAATAPVVSNVSYTYSGDDLTSNLRAYYNSTTGVVEFWVYLTAYDCVLLNGVWTPRVGTGDSWVMSSQDKDSATPPAVRQLSAPTGMTQLTPVPNYELGATVGATWGSNISSQPIDADILNAQQAWADLDGGTYFDITANGLLLKNTAANIVLGKSGGDGGAIFSNGKTTYNAGTGGFHLGWNSGLGKYTFGVGDSVNYMRWNGTALAVTMVTATGFSVKSATSGQRMEMSSKAIKIYDSSGVKRVQLGDLTA
jgi:hypothetical protein